MLFFFTRSFEVDFFFPPMHDIFIYLLKNEMTSCFLSISIYTSNRKSTTFLKKKKKLIQNNTLRWIKCYSLLYIRYVLLNNKE